MGDMYGYRDFLGSGTWVLPPAPNPNIPKIAIILTDLNGSKKSYGNPQEVFSSFNWDLNFVKSIWGGNKPPAKAEFEEVWVSYNANLGKSSLWAGSVASLKLCFLYSYASHYQNTYLNNMENSLVNPILDSEVAEYEIVDKVRAIIVDSESYKSTELRGVVKKIIAMFRNLGMDIGTTNQTEYRTLT